MLHTITRMQASLLYHGRMDLSRGYRENLFDMHQSLCIFRLPPITSRPPRARQAASNARYGTKFRFWIIAGIKEENRVAVFIGIAISPKREILYNWGKRFAKHNAFLKVLLYYSTSLCNKASQILHFALCVFLADCL